MWCSLSCKTALSSCSSISEASTLINPKVKKKKKKKIRVIHFNGYIEELEYPITVGELTGKLPKSHFLFTQAQLFSINGSKPPLKPDAVLELGKAYFLLPYSILESTVSPAELEPIARKLASVARNRRPSKSKPPSKLQENDGTDKAVDVGGMNNDNSASSSSSSSSKSRSWKPILATIREISFNRRSESDLAAAS